MPSCSRRYLSMSRGTLILVCVSMFVVLVGNHYLSGMKRNIVKMQTPITRGTLHQNTTSNQSKKSETRKVQIPKTKKFEHGVSNDSTNIENGQQTYWHSYNISGLRTRTESFSNERPLIVLILAYMHTGSSYLGELVKLPSKTFYLYEPLRALKDKVNKRQLVEFLNGTSLQMSEKTYTHVGGSTISDMFSCNFNKLDTSTLTERYTSFKSTNGRDQSDYFRCLSRKNFDHRPKNLRYSLLVRRAKSFNSLKYLKKSSMVIRSCLPKIIEKCENSTMRAIKVIRMSMDMLKHALQDFPNMRIIHLLRDPRAMLDSNVRKDELGVSVFSKFHQRTTYMCERMINDLKTAKRIKQEHAGQIFTLRYEDTVDRPLEVAKQVYDFMQVPFTSQEEDFVRKRSIDTRKNSTVRAAVWRHHISELHLKTVESVCHELFKMLGYKTMGSLANVRNLSISDHEEKLT